MGTGKASTTRLDADLRDDRLTLAGLLIETWTGFSAEIERRLKAECDLPLPWFGLLLRIARSPAQRLRLSDLARQTGLSPSGLTRALDRLEEVGYAERVACPSDRRGAFAAITPAGLRMLGPAVRAHLRHLDEVLLAVLAPDEQEELAGLLRRVRDHVNPGAAEPPQPVPADRPNGPRPRPGA